MDRKKKCLVIRELIGFILLTVLLLGGLLSSFLLGNLHRELARDMDSAAWYALRQDWEEATQIYTQTADVWRKKWNLCAAFSDHTPMEHIDAQFAQLSVYASLRNREEFAATCSALSKDLTAMGKAQELRWWNLF